MCVARGKGMVARCAAQRSIVVVLLFVVAFIVSPRLWGQGQSYLTGYIQDPSGAPVSNAAITIKNEATQASVELKTTNEGVYRSPSLEVGNYEVIVKAQGFQTSVTRDVAIEVGQSRGMNITCLLYTSPSPRD